MEMFTFASAVHGYRFYQDKPLIGESSTIKVALGNLTVSYLPHELSRIARYFFARFSEIGVKVISHRRYL